MLQSAGNLLVESSTVCLETECAVGTEPDLTQKFTGEAVEDNVCHSWRCVNKL